MLQWMDDFTSYGTDAGNAARMSNGPYAAVSRFDLQVDPDPTAGGETVLHGFGGGLGGIIRKVLTAAETTVGVAARYWLNFLPGNDTSQVPSFCCFMDINAAIHIRVSVNPSGYIEVWRRDNGGDVLIGQTAGPVIVATAWRHIETKVVIDAAVGSVEVRLEGLTVLNLAGIRTSSNVAGVVASCTNVSILSPSDASGSNIYVKDFIIWDGSGAENNNFFGSCQVYKIIPNGDVALGWTPSAGATGFNLIDETTPDDDGSYVSAPFPLPAPSSFSLSDLPANVTSVKGVMILNRSRKTDGGDGQLQASLLSGASVGAGANRTITTAYTYWWDIFDLDPQGAVNWTLARVNALNLKLDRTV